MVEITRRTAATAGAAALVARPSSAGPTARPNILWLVSEDNNPFLGAYGDRLARTPALDALARESVLYRNAYSNAPVCAPSRFGILTGVYPEACAPAHQMRATAKAAGRLKTYPELLRAAGYYCTNNAKTDYNCDIDPAAIWDQSGPRAHWRGRAAGQPFMAVFNHETTHESQLFRSTPGRVTPDQVRLPGYLPDTPDIRGDYASYYNLMEKLDGQIAARLAELAAEGLADDTIVFYYSDNGGVLPRSKRYCYDEGLRCALMVRLPARWAHLAKAPAGSAVDAPVSFIDLAPTLLALAGLPPTPQMQGRPFLGPQAGPQRYAFGMRNRMDERYDFVRTVTDGRWRYIRNYMPHRPWGMHGAFEWLAKGYQDWERQWRAGAVNADQARFFGTKPFEELYDLTADRDELRNRTADPAASGVLAAMRRALDHHILAINDNGFIPEGMTAEGYAESRDRTAYPLPRIMALAAAAGARDVGNLPKLTAALDDPNPIIRYWAASGLLILGPAASPTAARLRRVAEADPIAQVRVPAAEAIGAADILARLAADPAWQVQLQALNALTALGGAARPSLPAVRAAAESEQEYVRNAGRYLSAVLEGRYEPASPIFDLERLTRRTARPG